MNMNSIHFNLSLLKKIFIILAILFAMVSISSISFAVTSRTYFEYPKFVDNTGSRIVPSVRDLSGPTEAMPQLWGLADSNPYREVTLEDSRLLLKTNSWQATVSNGSVVYCADFAHTIREGQYNDIKNYLKSTDNYDNYYTHITWNATGESLGQQYLQLKMFLDMYFNGEHNPDRKDNEDWGYKSYKNNGSKSSETEQKKWKIDLEWGDLPSGVTEETLGYLITFSLKDYWGSQVLPGRMLLLKEEQKELAVEESKANLKGLYEARRTPVTGTKFTTPYDPGPDYEPPEMDAINGPVLAVIEQTEHGNEGYKKEEEIDFSNDAKSFIFSASEDAYSKSSVDAYGNLNYGCKYSLEDIQSAYWLLLADEGGKYPEGYVTEKGQELYEKAKEYEEFLKQDYNPSINDSEAQVIVDRNKQEYIVGPYTLNYPMYEDISYVKSITINDQDNLIYDYDHEGIKVVMKGKGTTVPGSNGIMKEYPTPGQSFFVVFSAKNAGYPTSVNLNVRFEHIQDSFAHTESYAGTANYYQYHGYCLIDEEDYNMDKTTLTVTVYADDACLETKHHKHEIDENQKDIDGDGILDHFEGDGCPEYDTYHNGYKLKYTETFEVYIPYYQLDDEPYYTEKAQKLTVVPPTSGGNGDSGLPEGGGSAGGSGEAGASGNAWRNYKIVLKTKKIDLTMELGGYVWVDEDGGKESVPNGKYDGSETEKRVPNIQVTLSDGQTTTTDENGEYRFKGLNAMNTYTVTFEYNGQYYQPTKWEPASTWDSDGWSSNSNAKDNAKERETFNLKFETIGSSPENYTGSEGANRTFTKQELLGYTLNSKGEYEKTRDAVIDEFGNLIKESSSDERTSQMIQYVKDCMMKAYTFDAYPYPSLFVIDKKPVTRDYMRCFKNQPAQLYDDAYYINLGLNPREESDLAIKKDVDHVTLEINGQTHTYNYNTLDTYICSNGHKGNNANLVTIKSVKNNSTILVCPDCITQVTQNDKKPEEYICSNNKKHTFKLEDLYYIVDENTEEDDTNQVAKTYVCPTCSISTRNEAWDISVRISDGYYNAAYSRELYKSDYLYKASMYGENFQEYGKSKEDELEVYITYKIMVRNQSMSIRAKVDEIVDYYDEDLEYIDERSYIEVKQSRTDAIQKGIYSVGASSNSIYSNNTKSTIKGYNNLYITGLAKTNKEDKKNYLAAGQTAYIYLTFKVKKEARDGEDWVKLDEQLESGEPIGVGKENIIEVNGYSTQYAKGTQVPNVGDVSFKPAGIVDTDSNPGNLADTGIQKDKADTSVFTKFEDDTDKAPNIRIILYRDDDTTRVISGSVWEDARTQEIDVTTTGDGFKDKEATMINGVTVQLVELMENGTEYVWREFGDNNTEKPKGLGGENTVGKGTGSGTVTSETPIINAYDLIPNYEFGENHDGQYAFKSFMPGKYVVRFIYGDTVRTVTPKSLNMGGLNEKSYNGQDYKSTTYQKGITQNKVYTWREASTWNLGEETLGKILTEVSTFKPDASNNETTQLPKKDGNGNFETISIEEQKGYLYDITESEKYNGSDKDHPLVSDAKDIESKRNAVNDYSDNDVTNYVAEVVASHKADYTTLNDRNQLLKDLMSNTKMTAETGLMVIELEYDRTETLDQEQNNTTSYKIQNVDLGLEERPKAQLVIDKEVTNVKLTLADGSILFDAKNKATNVLWKDHKAYQVGYKGNVMDPNKFGDLQNIRNKNASKFGLIQLTMDEELMHGATIEITYQVGLTNVGEVDYKDNLFYYTGNKSENAQVVTTKANQVIDYVANNLQFNAQNNSNWHVISKDDIKAQGLVNSKLESQVDKYNTIIVTEALNKDLVPNLYKEKVDKDSQDSISVPLVLTQLITSENDTDDLTYRNLVEIVKTSNTVGRRMEYSVVGNQDPEANPQELDSDIAEVVRILPPFGNALNYTLLATIAIAAISIVTGGIIFIKKKVLKK